jgi:hypothetical protein
VLIVALLKEEGSIIFSLKLLGISHIVQENLVAQSTLIEVKSVDVSIVALLQEGSIFFLRN